tara:strand:- start:86 stop:1273 length:1188 start_codon:yes stop_codon:yes gene_type:complete
MTATTGDRNWIKNWKGRGDQNTFIKVNSAVLYEENGIKSNVILTKGQSVTYIDGQSKDHLRVAIKVGEEIYRTKIDNLLKPSSIGGIDLKPQSFGVVGRSFNISDYISTLKKNIQLRDDIKGELEEYLLDLVDAVEFGKSGIGGYDLSTIPLATVEKDFGEALGPIHCIKRGLVNKNLGITQATSIFVPSFGSEPLVDYILRNPSGISIRVSAKGSKTSNTLKPRFLVPPVRETPILAQRHLNSTEFQVLGLLHDYSTNEGAIRAALLLGKITQRAFGTITNFANSTKLSDIARQEFSNLIDSDLNTKGRKSIDMRQLSKLCENIVVKYSKDKSQKYTKIVNDVLNNDIIIVKLAITNGLPFFTIAQSYDGNIANISLRNKNSFNVGGEKLGFQL